MKIPSSASPLSLAVSLLLLWPGLRPAAAQLLGPEFQVNSYTTSYQEAPAVAAHGSGNFVVVWGSDGPDGSSYGVFGQRFNPTGSPVGGEFQVNTYTTSHQNFPAVAAGSSGSFVVVWHSYGQDGSNLGVFGQRFNSVGAPVGSEFQANSYTTSYQWFPKVAADGSGNFVVVWWSSDQDGSSYGVFGQRFNSTGSPVGSEFRVNSYTTSSQVAPAVATEGAGNFVVVWTSRYQDGQGDGVFGQRFDSAGNPVGSEFQVNSFTTGRQGSPAVAVDGSGNFVVAWESYLQDGSDPGVFGQRFDSAGVPVGPEFQVNSYTTSGQRSPALAADGSGNFVVVWDSIGQDGSHEGVFGQRFNSAGSPVGSEFQINSYTTSYQQIPVIAADGSGNFVVVWESYGQIGSNDMDVFGQRLNSANAIFRDGFDAGNACAWSAAVGGGCP